MNDDERTCLDCDTPLDLDRYLCPPCCRLLVMDDAHDERARDYNRRGWLG